MKERVRIIQESTGGIAELETLVNMALEETPGDLVSVEVMPFQIDPNDEDWFVAVVTYRPMDSEVLGEHLSYDECTARAPAEDADRLSFDEWREIHGGGDD